MKLLKKAILTTPLLATACAVAPLSSCGLDGKNSVYFDGNSKILTTNQNPFTFTIYLRYLLQGGQKVILRIVDTKPESGFTFKDYYTKYNLIGRRLEFEVDFTGTVGTSTTFNIEVYGVKQSQIVWSSTITGFTLVYTNQ